jgi:hypothetical protein
MLVTRVMYFSEEGKALTWTEENIKTHLYLYLGLLPLNHALIHEYGHIFLLIFCFMSCNGDKTVFDFFCVPYIILLCNHFFFYLLLTF